MTISYIFRDERKIFDNFTTKAIENVNNELSEAGAAASSQGRNEYRKSGKKNWSFYFKLISFGVQTLKFNLE